MFACLFPSLLDFSHSGVAVAAVAVAVAAVIAVAVAAVIAVVTPSRRYASAR